MDKTNETTIQNYNNLYIQVIHAYFTRYIYAHNTYASLPLEVTDRPTNQPIIHAMYHVINIQTHYNR
jgi:hypothetical protein